MDRDTKMTLALKINLPAARDIALSVRIVLKDASPRCGDGYPLRIPP